MSVNMSLRDAAGSENSSIAASPSACTSQIKDRHSDTEPQASTSSSTVSADQVSEISSTKSANNLAAKELLGSLLLRNTEGIIFFISSDGKIEFVSENVTQALGFKQDDLLGKRIFSIVSHSDHEQIKTLFPSSSSTFATGSEEAFDWDAAASGLSTQKGKSKTFRCRLIKKVDATSSATNPAIVLEWMQFTAYLTPHPLPVDQDIVDVLIGEGNVGEATKLCLVCVAKKIPFEEATTSLMSRNSSPTPVPSVANVGAAAPPPLPSGFTTKMNSHGVVLGVDNPGHPSLLGLPQSNFEASVMPEDVPIFRRHIAEVTSKPQSETWSQPYRFQIANQFYFIQSCSKVLQKFIISKHSILNPALKSSLPTKDADASATPTALTLNRLKQHLSGNPCKTSPMSGVSSTMGTSMQHSNLQHSNLQQPQLQAMNDLMRRAAAEAISTSNTGPPLSNQMGLVDLLQQKRTQAEEKKKIFTANTMSQPAIGRPRLNISIAQQLQMQHLQKQQQQQQQQLLQYRGASPKIEPTSHSEPSLQINGQDIQFQSQQRLILQTQQQLQQQQIQLQLSAPSPVTPSGSTVSACSSLDARLNLLGLQTPNSLGPVTSPNTVFSTASLASNSQDLVGVKTEGGVLPSDPDSPGINVNEDKRESGSAILKQLLSQKDDDDFEAQRERTVKRSLEIKKQEEFEHGVHVKIEVLDETREKSVTTTTSKESEDCHLLKQLLGKDGDDDEANDVDMDSKNLSSFSLNRASPTPPFPDSPSAGAAPKPQNPLHARPQHKKSLKRKLGADDVNGNNRQEKDVLLRELLARKSEATPSVKTREATSTGARLPQDRLPAPETLQSRLRCHGSTYDAGDANNNGSVGVGGDFGMSLADSMLNAGVSAAARTEVSFSLPHDSSTFFASETAVSSTTEDELLDQILEDAVELEGNYSVTKPADSTTSAVMNPDIPPSGFDASGSSSFSDSTSGLLVDSIVDLNQKDLVAVPERDSETLKIIESFAQNPNLLLTKPPATLTSPDSIVCAEEERLAIGGIQSLLMDQTRGLVLDGQSSTMTNADAGNVSFALQNQPFLQQQQPPQQPQQELQPDQLLVGLSQTQPSLESNQVLDESESSWIVEAFGFSNLTSQSSCNNNLISPNESLLPSASATTRLDPPPTYSQTTSLRNKNQVLLDASSLPRSIVSAGVQRGTTQPGFSSGESGSQIVLQNSNPGSQQIHLLLQQQPRTAMSARSLPDTSSITMQVNNNNNNHLVQVGIQNNNNNHNHLMQAGITSNTDLYNRNRLLQEQKERLLENQRQQTSFQTSPGSFAYPEPGNLNSGNIPSNFIDIMNSGMVPNVSLERNCPAPSSSSSVSFSSDSLTGLITGPPAGPPAGPGPPHSHATHSRASLLSPGNNSANMFSWNNNNQFLDSNAGMLVPSVGNEMLQPQQQLHMTSVPPSGFDGSLANMQLQPNTGGRARGRGRGRGRGSATGFGSRGRGIQPAGIRATFAPDSLDGRRRQVVAGVFGQDSRVSPTSVQSSANANAQRPTAGQRNSLLQQLLQTSE